MPMTAKYLAEIVGASCDYVFLAITFMPRWSWTITVTGAGMVWLHFIV